MNLYHKLNIPIFLTCVVLITIILASLVSLYGKKEVIFLAVALPIEAKEEHENIKTALNIYKNDVNGSGGIEGKYLEIEFFPNLNETNTRFTNAKNIARAIVEQKKFMAVLGHFNSKETEAAIPIYDNAGIPIIDPISDIDTKSDSAFQTRPSPESYGVYMAHYIKSILGKSVISIIYSKDENNNKLTTSFKNEFKKIDGQVTALEFSDTKSVVKILKEADKTNTNHHMLLLATKDEETIKIIEALDNLEDLTIPIMLANTSVTEGEHVLTSKNVLYAPSIMFLDSLLTPELARVAQAYRLRKNANKQYEIDKENSKRQDITQIVMNTVLSASFVVDGLKHTLKEMKKNKESYIYSTFDKRLLIQQIKNIKIKNAKWFNDEKQGVKNLLFIGEYKKPYLRSAPINPTLIDELPKS